MLAAPAALLIMLLPGLVISSAFWACLVGKAFADPLRGSEALGLNPRHGSLGGCSFCSTRATLKTRGEEVWLSCFGMQHSKRFPLAPVICIMRRKFICIGEPDIHVSPQWNLGGFPAYTLTSASFWFCLWWYGYSTGNWVQALPSTSASQGFKWLLLVLVVDREAESMTGHGPLTYPLNDLISIRKYVSSANYCKGVASKC